MYMISPEVLRAMACNPSLKGAKYRRGNKVTYKGKEYIVYGVNYAHDDQCGKPIFEYCLEELNILVWEEELS